MSDGLRGGGAVFNHFNGPLLLVGAISGFMARLPATEARPILLLFHWLTAFSCSVAFAAAVNTSYIRPAARRRS